MIVRRASLDDLDAMIGPGAMVLARIARHVPGMPVNVQAMANALARLLISDQACVFVVERSGKLLGGIGGALTREPFAGDVLMLVQHFLWAVPGHRAGAIGSRMVRAFETWGAAHGAVFCVLNSLDCLEDRTPQLFAHRGYVPTTRHFVRRVG